MANATELKSKFTEVLKSMFQLDQPELDFGLYRIMHAKADRINRFLETELAQQIDAVFEDADQANQNQVIEAAKQKLITQLGYSAFDENDELAEHFKTVPAAKDYLNAVEKAKATKGNLSERAVIYDHLIRFFKRYYDGGDFMSRRYHVAENKSRAAVYAVPYDGSEVYLHWANKDQYYIKTTESFNLYSFDISEAAKKHAESFGQSAKTGLLNFEEATQLANKRIHFKLVDAAQGEHNNNKESEKRQFFIRAEQPVALNDEGELEVYFEFRVATKADTITAEREKQLKTRFGASKKGDLPNLYITQVIQDELSAMQSQAGTEDFITFAQILAPTDKVKQRPLITKYINNYTSKNTMDYFIHKDLGGFLQRELDFYIKNEIMRLDDIEQASEANYARLLKQIKTLRSVAKDIIKFLAQIENFQKKLWLKKKFVTETNYCITLDRLACHTDLLETALSNDAQRKEWVDLFGIDLKEMDKLREQGADKLFNDERFSKLIIDTKFYLPAYRDDLLSRITLLDDKVDGIMIHSENFQAINALTNKLESSVSCIYIDPPYNSPSSQIAYKNEYKHSSWMSLMENRLSSARKLQDEKCSVIVAIDENEANGLERLMYELFPQFEVVKIAIQHNKKGIQGNHFSYSSEFGIFAIPPERKKLNRAILPESEWEYSNLRNWGGESLRADGKTCFYPILVKNGRIVGFGDVCEDSYSPVSANILRENGIIEIYPIDEQGIERKWRYSRDTVQSISSLLKVDKARNGDLSIKKAKNDSQFKTMWYDSKYNAGDYGTSILTNMGIDKSLFDFPKSLYTVRDSIFAASDTSGYVLDYFAGSGTTGHAVIRLNKEDNGNRRFVLVEMGNYFDAVTKPRVQKAIYAEGWKDGRPIFDKEGKAGGVSQCFKYLRLEQYEDTLNNLVDGNSYNPESVPKDFMLSYLLEAETAESPSLLNLEQFSNPRNYKLQIKKPNSDQSSPQVIDLVETFNWLIGLHVEKLDKWRAYDCEFEREQDPELPQDQNTRLKVSQMTEANAYAEDAPIYQIRVVEGWVRRIPGNDELRDKVLVIWRNLSDDPEKDSAFLEALLDSEKADIGKIIESDSQFDKIYINGPHGLQLRGSAKTRLLSLEDTFMTKMWEDA
ncbi:DNA methyltransferase [Idiomarina aquatica]|uniref:DNA methyltransferase n=1 Tax=Idiomarina aquatica TaxID=1327752 RepID=A0AA94EFI5_9GAMM|nr:site-specific DNA-methyltransferase [Idiomarina aquatica]RUO44531.1 DNA methyltransferase [Idiomarina aquatica]